MNVLILGSGGREHALAWKISQSPELQHLFVAPGNAGTANMATNVALSLMDFESIRSFVLEQHISLLVVGPEAPLVEGLVDYLDDNPVPDLIVIGPHAEGAQLEGSKAFAKKFMQRHSIPTAAYRSFDKSQRVEALEYVRNHSTPIVLKADGLAAGKGVIICASREEALTTLEQSYFGGKFGEAGSQVVIEEFLDGIEFSVFVLTNGKGYLLLPEAKDYKRIGEGDTGLNTGGMGAVSPVPFVDERLMDKVKKRIIEPTIRGLQAESIPYCGFVFFGLILVDGDPYVIEYNCRMGDPETEVVLPRIDSDLVPLLYSIRDQDWPQGGLTFRAESATTVMCVSEGYPEAYEKGKQIKVVEDQDTGKILFHAGTIVRDGKVETNGGRVIAATALGLGMEDALKKSYEAVDQIDFEGKTFRKDIGKDLHKYL